MYDIINGVYHVSMATILLTFVVSLICLMGILITSQSSDNFSFKEALKKHKKSILISSILIVVSLFIFIKECKKTANLKVSQMNCTRV